MPLSQLTPTLIFPAHSITCPRLHANTEPLSPSKIVDSEFHSPGPSLVYRINNSSFSPNLSFLYVNVLGSAFTFGTALADIGAIAEAQSTSTPRSAPYNTNLFISRYIPFPSGHHRYRRPKDSVSCMRQRPYRLVEKRSYPPSVERRTNRRNEVASVICGVKSAATRAVHSGVIVASVFPSAQGSGQSRSTRQTSQLAQRVTRELKNAGGD